MNRTILRHAHNCRRSFPFFADRFCFVLSDAGGAAGQSWVRFRLWPAQRDVAERMQAHRLVVVLKSRQLGLTWLALAFALWLMLFHPIAQILLFSKRDDEATDMLERFKEMYRRLPSWLRARQVVTSNNHEFKLSSGSRVLAFPTSGGDSYTGTLAVVDEADLVPNLDQMLAAVKPTVDNNGRLLLISRADKSKPESPFKKVYRGAKTGQSEWHPVFLPWHARPGRTAEWYKKQRLDVLTRTGALDDLFEQYPADDAEALAPRSLDKRLPLVWLRSCYQPAAALTVPGAPALQGLTVFVAPQQGRTYVIGADPAEGNPTSDESAADVLDEETGEQAATLAGRFEVATFAAHIDTVGQWYGFAPVMVERNNHGHAVLLWLRDNSSLTRLCGEDGKPGWNTNTKGKAAIYDLAAVALRDGDTTIHDTGTFEQLASIEGSTLRAPPGQLDDRATAHILGLAGRNALARRGPLNRELVKDILDTATTPLIVRPRP